MVQWLQLSDEQRRTTIEQASVRRGGSGKRRQAHQDALRAHHAQCAGPDHRPGHLRRPRGDSVRSVSQLPGRRHPAADAVVGIDGKRRGGRNSLCACHGHLPVHRPVADLDGLQLPRRRAA